MAITGKSRNVAVVTGGGSGISLVVVKMLLAKSYDVSILDLDIGGASELVKTTHPSSGATAIFQKCDISNWSTVQECFRVTKKRLGPIRIVVNGAGVYEPDWSNFWKNTESSSYKTLDINLAASIKICRLAISEFLGNEDSRGTVINISSIAGQRASFYCPLYTASKWGISGFTRAMATLEKDPGIRVLAVAPGIVRTPLWTASPKGSMLTDDDEWVEPEEVAEAIVDMIEGMYKGGDVVEVLTQSRREVPLALPLPSGPGATVSNGKQIMNGIMDELKKERECSLKKANGLFGTQNL